MATTAYDRVGAMGGLFAPAFIHGDPVSEEAVNAWNLRNRRNRPVDMWQPPAQAVAATTAAEDPRATVAGALYNQIRPGGGGEGPAPGYGLDPGLDQGPTPGPFSGVQSPQDLGPPDVAPPANVAYAPPTEDVGTPASANTPAATPQAAPAPAPVAAPTAPAPVGFYGQAFEDVANAQVPSQQDMATALGVNDVMGVVAPNAFDEATAAATSPVGYGTVGPATTSPVSGMVGMSPDPGVATAVGTLGSIADTAMSGPVGVPSIGAMAEAENAMDAAAYGNPDYGYSESTDQMGGMQGFDAFGDVGYGYGDVGYGDVGYGDVGDEGAAEGADAGDAGDAGDGSDGDGDGDGGDY